MAHRVVTFPAAESSVASRVSVTGRSGRVQVFGEDRTDIEVEGALRASLDNDAGGAHVIVEGTSDHIVVHCPVGTDVLIGTLSGRVGLAGPLGEARVTTSSGRVDVGEVASVDVRTRSGSIRVGRCDGAVRARTTSGRISVDAASQLDAASTSGAITARSIRGATVRTTSGRVELAVRDAGSVAVRTVSGRVEISLPPEARPELLLRSLTGRIDDAIESGHEGTVGVETVTGRIQVRAR